MFRGMTGEVFVTRGLEEALNIDRNSFNETDLQFVALRRFLFQFLGIPDQTGITDDIRQRSRDRQNTVREGQLGDSLDGLTRRLGRLTRFTWQWELDDTLETPLEVRRPEGLILVNLEHDAIPRANAAKKEFLRFYLAVQMRDSEGTDLRDTAQLLNWLKGL